MAEDARFARLVSLACHDLRTPLATVYGFARTLGRSGELEEPQSRYVEMIEAASSQMSALLDDLGVLARIEGRRYEPNLQPVDSLVLARAAAARLDGRAAAAGVGGSVTVDHEASERALAAFAECALRHGPVERVELAVSGREVRIGPVTEAAAPVIMAEEMRDLGAVVARAVVEALGGSVGLADGTLTVRLPA